MGLLMLMGDSGFNVRSELFGAGEQGAWYDPSDFSTMWQDAAGDTPVTASGDPVGLILDKSRSGPSMGSNQITNGGFGADSDWTKGTGWTIGSGVATKAAGSASVLSQAQTMTAGRYYIVTYTITRTAGSITPQFAGGSTVSGTARSTSGTFTDIMTAVSGNNTVQFSADASFAGTVDDVSVKVLSAGNHAYQVSSAARPTLTVSSGLTGLVFDGTDDFLQTNTIDFTASDEMSIFAGIRKSSDTSRSMVVELGQSWQIDNGSFGIEAPQGNGLDGFRLVSRGTTSNSQTPTGYAAPTTRLITMLADISAPSLVGRIGGVQVVNSTASQGTGNFSSNRIFIGRRNGTEIAFNGIVYQLIVRGLLTSGVKLTGAERFAGAKAGLTI
jgi:hypothetical protein